MAAQLGDVRTASAAAAVEAIFSREADGKF
jgi:hypothetical protein